MRRSSWSMVASKATCTPGLESNWRRMPGFPGNVYYTLIEMQLGAMVDGQLVHVRAESDVKSNVHPLAASRAKKRAERGRPGSTFDRGPDRSR